MLSSFPDPMPVVFSMSQQIGDATVHPAPRLPARAGRSCAGRSWRRLTREQISLLCVNVDAVVLVEVAPRG
jgi:hypothetical protein